MLILLKVMIILLKHSFILQPLWWADEGAPATTKIRDDVRFHTKDL